MEPAVIKNARPATKKRRTMSDGWYAVLLIAPAMVIILFFALVPLFYATDVSFRHADLTMGGLQGWVGLNNYREVLHEAKFWTSVWTTVTFTFFAIVVEMGLGIFIAFLIYGATWGKGLMRSLLILPLATAPAVTGLFWRYLYDTQFGLFNYFIHVLGINWQPNWLGDIKLGMASLVIFDTWLWMPFVAMIVLAGLQSLPKEPFEAAELDGASTFRVLRTLTFPMLSPVLTLVFILRTIDCLRLYDSVATLTRGGPGDVTETLTYYLFRQGLVFFRMDYASTMALLFMFAVILASGFVLRPLLTRLAKRAGQR
ncbi:MAG: sugar ABC transporter permease [Anaerolineales bacterium]|nr:sugar ABC transporter permease [Anaerolineales bacterium]